MRYHRLVRVSACSYDLVFEVIHAMSSELGSLHNELFKQYKLLHDKKTGAKAQQDFNSIWAEAKTKCSTKNELTKFAKNLLADYRQQNSAREAANVMYYFTAASKQSVDKNITPS